jgi:hypothetical protein
LRGYQLVEGIYQPIGDGMSLALGLRLVMDRVDPSNLIGFFRVDTGEKLLRPMELQSELIVARAKLAEYESRFGPLGNED